MVELEIESDFLDFVATGAANAIEAVANLKMMLDSMVCVESERVDLKKSEF